MKIRKTRHVRWSEHSRRRIWVIADSELTISDWVSAVKSANTVM